MPSLSRLPALRSAEDLLAFLRDDLGWPLPLDALVDELTFDWTGEDLRLPQTATQRLAGGSVRQLRTMFNGQPWGVFLVEFATPRLYRTALRGVLRGLVPSRRQDPALAAWQHENLLFLCAAADYAQITFAHFRGGAAGRARLATFGWEQGRHFARTLLEINLPALAWPRTPADGSGWLRQWSAAFDVEPVTREFFRVYRSVFEQVERAAAGLDADPERRRLWTQRLFNRLMFIAFVEKKGWLTLGGRTDYLAALWDAWTARPTPDMSFYNARLRPLFFFALNNPGHRDILVPGGGLLGQVLGGVPYLNGGLFEQDADDQDAAIGVPDAAVGAILGGLFARFHFTVTESTPLDVEVAVDPEMLGKVFEELVTGRHESGSYYTPKPIVAFMCREALRHHLAGRCPGEDPAAVDAFIHGRDPAALRDGEAVLRALRAVRVCDPACGSGAYLLGMLHELLELRACLFASRRLDAVTNHARKLEIIQRNLYGVDLDPFAVNVARLRLWLSLAVEYEGGEPPPLPNLDFKIECGDSLAAPDPQGVFHGQMEFGGDTVLDFQRAKAAYLAAHGEDKRRLRAEADALRARVRDWLQTRTPAGAFDWAVEFAEVFAPRAAASALDGGFNLGDTLAPAPEPGGFDLILANPPYVRQELIRALKPVLKSRYACYEGTADLFVYFYERAVQLLRPGGTLAFISSNKWYRTGYGGKLRALLARETAVQTLVDFGDAPVFGAIAYAAILVAVRARPGPGAAARALTWNPATDGPGFERVGEVVAARGQPLAQSALGADGWRLESPGVLRLLAKLRANGRPLGEYVEKRMYWGIKTGLNEAFVVDRATRDRLIAEHASSAGVLKPFLRGKDVKRWAVTPQNLWLIFMRRGVENKKFPAIMAHLSLYKTALMPGGEGGRKPGSYKWYELQDNVAYWNDFHAPKVIIPAISQTSNVAIDTLGFFSNNKTSIAVCDNPSFICAVVNSSPAQWFAKQTFAGKQGGFFDFEPRYSSQWPIPPATPAEQADLAALVDRILAAKRAGDPAAVRALEAEIDERVCRLYGLTAEERAIVAEG